MTDEAVRPRQELRGVGVSSGIGFGQARVMNSGSLQLPQYQIEASQSQQLAQESAQRGESLP